jgi:hypothetical protein
MSFTLSSRSLTMVDLISQVQIARFDVVGMRAWSLWFVSVVGELVILEQA